MTLTLSRQDYQAILKEAVQAGDIAYKVTETENFFEYPPQLAKGYHRQLQLRSGLSLSLDERITQEHLILKSPEKARSVSLFFNMAGDFDCDCGGYVGPGHALLAGSYTVKEIAEYPAHERLLHIGIGITSHLLGELVTGQLTQIPSALQKVIEGVEDCIFFKGVITPSMQIALQQIVQCPYQGAFKRLYLESKALELIALQLIQVVDPGTTPHSRSSLQAGDIDCIHHAKAILIENFDHPPSLLELARLVGLNDRKLKQGFREVFDTTPFAYLRTYRLEQAQHLLMNSDLSVETIAKSIGYCDRSRFAAAFRKQFGINPKAYQLQYRVKEI